VFHSVVAHSEDLETQSAAEEITQQARAMLGEHPAQAGMLFASIDYDLPLLVSAIHKALPDMVLIGATTDGEISSSLGFAESSAVLHVFSSDEVEFVGAVARNASTDTLAKLREAITKAKSESQKDAVLCVTVPESLTMSGSQLTAQLKEVLGKTFPIVGGTAADNRRVEKTFQFFGGEVLSDSVPMLFFCGPLLFSHGRVSGWEPIGKSGTVTKVENNNVILEINGEPALAFFARYLGEEVPPGPGAYAEYPLILKGEDGERRQVAVHSVDTATGSVRCFGDVPDRAEIWLTEADRNMVVRGSEASVKAALLAFPGDAPSAALIFSCASRKAILGTRTAEEATALQATIPDVAMSGFYTYGEISPATKGAPPHFNNAMFVTLLLGT